MYNTHASHFHQQTSLSTIYKTTLLSLFSKFKTTGFVSPKQAPQDN